MNYIYIIRNFFRRFKMKKRIVATMMLVVMLIAGSVPFRGGTVSMLYSDMYHKVRINYYPPRGDEKESWDNIDIFGWMGYPMTLKVNFLCRDSILAAPLVLDLILFSDIAQRAGEYGIQEFMSFYCKAPMHKDGEKPVHDLFKQFAMLKNKIRELAGYEADQELD